MRIWTNAALPMLCPRVRADGVVPARSKSAAAAAGLLKRSLERRQLGGNLGPAETSWPSPELQELRVENQESNWGQTLLFVLFRLKMHFSIA